VRQLIADEVVTNVRPSMTAGEPCSVKGRTFLRRPGARCAALAVSARTPHFRCQASAKDAGIAFSLAKAFVRSTLLAVRTRHEAYRRYGTSSVARSDITVWYDGVDAVTTSTTAGPSLHKASFSAPGNCWGSVTRMPLHRIARAIAA